MINNQSVVTTKSLREILFEELSLSRNGKSLPSRTNAISRNISQILATSKLELDSARLMLLLGKDKNESLGVGPVVL